MIYARREREREIEREIKSYKTACSSIFEDIVLFGSTILQNTKREVIYLNEGSC